jgi:hypothetical protein
MSRHNYFVIAHQDFPWQIPFEHQVIGVEGYSPTHGVAAGSVISRQLDSETAFGALRAMMAINQQLNDQEDFAPVFMSSYRLFLGQETHEDWLSPLMQENRIISPDELTNNWQNIIATDMPSGVDIMIPAPRLLPDTLLGQYARVHHLDDLMLAVGCAIRAGLLESISVPTMLSSNTLIPYGLFAATKSIRQEFNQKLWSCALDFYKHHYVPRSAYQRRVIDFVFERISSMAIVQLITRRKLNCVSARNIWVSSDGVYRPTN